MGENIENKVITIKHEIDETPEEDDFQIITKIISTNSIKPGSNLILIKCLQISIDPYQLNRMKKWSPGHNSVMAASKLIPAQEIDSHGVGKVVASGHPQFQKDDLVKGRLSWAQYVVVEDVNLNLLIKFDPTPFPLSYHLGVLGTSGLTAYSGLFRLGQPKKGERVLVSSASGSVGHLVGQYAKLFGCYVVGCAGAAEKVILLKEKLGFDEAFNYREESNLKSTLKRYFPEGIDIYFDNVGGEMLEAAVANMNTFGRVLVCGVISEYTNPTKSAAPNMIDVIYKRITIRGFLVADHMDDSNLSDFVSTTSNYLRAGKLQVLTTKNVAFRHT